jgi:phage/plasmid-like protein (TIGR03299 family)
MSIPETFASVKPAWHRVGTVLSNEARTDYNQALKDANLDFEVKKIQFKHPLSDNPLYTNLPEDMNAYGTFRMDNGQHLGTVKGQYHVIQNHEALNFLEELVGGGMQIDSLGSFRKGTVIFANVLIKKDEIVKGDEVNNFMQVVTSHDGTLTLDFFQSMVQIVCSNTLRMAMKSASQHLKISHTVNSLVKLADAATFLNLVGKGADSFNDKLRFLSTKRMSSEMEELFLNQLVGKVDSSTKNKRLANMRETILESPDNSEIVKGISGTAYAMLNKVTNFVDHGDTSSTEEKKAVSAAFGTGDARKTKAFELLLEMAKTM